MYVRACVRACIQWFLSPCVRRKAQEEGISSSNSLSRDTLTLSNSPNENPSMNRVESKLFSLSAEVERLSAVVEEQGVYKEEEEVGGGKRREGKGKRDGGGGVGGAQ